MVAVWNSNVAELPLHLQYEVAAVAIVVGCVRSFRTHIALDNRVFRRENKGAIGSRSCGEMAGSVMRRVDVRLKKRLGHFLNELNTTDSPICMYKRYVDDITGIARIKKGVIKEELELCQKLPGWMKSRT